MYDAQIAGVYTTEQARDLSGRGAFSLALEALQGAVADAGLSLSDIDGVCANVLEWPLFGTDAPPFLTTDGQFWAKQLGRPLSYSDAGFASIFGVMNAAEAIDAGRVQTVALIGAGARPPQQGKTAAWTRMGYEFTEWTGSYTAVQYALVAQRYIHEFGDAAIEAMAEISATIRNFGHLNPEAVYYGRGPFTPDDILESRPIASPLTLLMCPSVNDGAACVILTSRERAASGPKKPIDILAGARQVAYPMYFDAPLLDAVPDASAFVRREMSRTGITYDDIDVVEAYDHFAIGVLLESELYGFCGRGEAADWVKTGVLRLDGRYPTCTDGGLHSHSHNGMPPLFPLIEAVRQLRGEACTQVPGAEVAFVTNPGPPTCAGDFMIVARGR